MLKLAVLTFSALMPFSAALAQPEPRMFVADGATIEYTAAVDADGILHLKGRAGKGEPFHFRLTRGGRLHGYVADRVVDVRVSRSRADRAFRGASTTFASAAALR